MAVVSNAKNMGCGVIVPLLLGCAGVRYSTTLQPVDSVETSRIFQRPAAFSEIASCVIFGDYTLTIVDTGVVLRTTK